MVRALVSATAVEGVVRAHADRAHDIARRLGCTDPEATDATRRAADQLIADLHQDPESVRDLVGAFFSRVRAHAESIRQTRMVGTTYLNPPADAPAGDLESAAQRTAVERALGSLRDEDRFALLVRDSYDLTVHQAAVAMSLDAPESARKVALARLELFAAFEGDEPISLAGHDIAVGDLGQLADGSAPPGGRFAVVRRHVAGCALCASVLDAESRATAMLSALPVLALDDTDRDGLLATTARHAADVLPSDEKVQRELEEGSSRGPIVSPLIVLGILLVALLAGLGFGALLSSDKTGGTGVTDTVTPTTTATSASAGLSTDDVTSSVSTPSGASSISGPATSVAATVTVTKTTMPATSAKATGTASPSAPSTATTTLP